jgi:hypothetical protein
MSQKSSLIQFPKSVSQALAAGTGVEPDISFDGLTAERYGQ